MFLLQALTPPGHEVLLIDGDAQPMSDAQLVQFVRERGIQLVGISSMTRVIAKAYKTADSIRAAGVSVVIGGPHVTGVPEEALGRDGGPRHADAVALGEADETWPKIVEDAARGELKEVYASVDALGQERKPSLQDYPKIPWDRLDIGQFNRIPGFVRPIMERFRINWETFHLIPIESARGCPYGCEFCTVTGFFGGSLRFRSNQSVVEEMLRLKAHARRSRGKIAVFFVDDNFAINLARAKSLLRDIAAAGAQLPWVGQISANLLRDEELADLIAASGGKCIFIGMESVNPASLASVNKSFNKPGEYAAVLERLAQRNICAITSFIFGLDNDTPGVAKLTLSQMRDWPPGLPVFGQIIPFPATPLHARLEREGRLTRPKYWLDSEPFYMAHTPLKMTSSEVEAEVKYAWTNCYRPAATGNAIDSIKNGAVPYKIGYLVARLVFRGIYFPQKGAWTWLKMIAQHRGTFLRLFREWFTNRRGVAGAREHLGVEASLGRSSSALSTPPGARLD